MQVILLVYWKFLKQCWKCLLVVQNFVEHNLSDNEASNQQAYLPVSFRSVKEYDFFTRLSQLFLINQSSFLIGGKWAFNLADFKNKQELKWDT